MSLTIPVFDVGSERNELWDHCRNALGIGRLLVHESRPASLVATACQMAVESACRAALAHAELRFDGDVGRALLALGAPTDLWQLPAGVTSAARLAATQRLIAWVAAYLRSQAPGRTWGY
jgi:hypothetical protein